jgi:hypothetical protein
MLVDLKKIRKARLNQEVEEKIERYTQKLRIAMNQIDEILDDIEDSGINWFETEAEQKEKIEGISTIGLFMETYVGWSRE